MLDVPLKKPRRTESTSDREMAARQEDARVRGVAHRAAQWWSRFTREERAAIRDAAKGDVIAPGFGELNTWWASLPDDRRREIAEVVADASTVDAGDVDNDLRDAIVAVIEACASYQSVPVRIREAVNELADMLGIEDSEIEQG